MASTASLHVIAASTPGVYTDVNIISGIFIGLSTMNMRNNTALSLVTVGTEGTDWSVYTSSGVAQTGFTLTIGKGGTINFNKTSHGLSPANAFLAIAANNVVGKILITSEL